MELINKNNKPKGNFLQVGQQKEIIRPEDFVSKSSEEIITFIIDHFHAHLRKVIPELTRTLLKIMDHHIHEYKDLFWEIHELFAKIRDTFEAHLILEEKLIFEPMRKSIAGELQEDSEEHKLMIKSIKESMDEHFVIGPCLKKINELTNNYVAPQNACGSIKKFYMELKDFQLDVMTHTQIENNILFPRFLAE